MTPSISDDLTLTGVLSAAATSSPSRPAISVPTTPLLLSHSLLHNLVESTAARLAAAGVLPGHVVALTLPNTPEFVILFLAIIRARAVAAPLNSAYTADEFQFYLSDSKSSLLLTSAAGNPAATAAAAALSIPHSSASLVSSSHIAFTSLPHITDPPPPLTPNSPSDDALFLHTSGTTSRPKGVPLTQRNLAASVTNIRSAYRLSPTDATLIVLPLFHVHGLVAGLLSSLAAGASVALPASGRFSASTFWSDMRASGATWYTAVPTVHQIILAATPESTQTPALRFIRSCSASLAPAVMGRMEDAFGSPVLEAYAMTEASHMMATNPLPEDGVRKPGTVGRPAGIEMAVLDGEGRRVPAGEEGEVCIRGETVTAGYKNNEKANAEAFLFGWFHTGDIGVMDEDGYLRLVGRIKELINRGGEKISPIEVDAVLLAHPDVAEAVAFGVPDEKYGEEINCAVIPREGVEIGEEEVVRHCRKNLAAFKVPKRVFITDSVPRTATGKIQRRIVAEHFLSSPAAA